MGATAGGTGVGDPGYIGNAGRSVAAAAAAADAAAAGGGFAGEIDVLGKREGERVAVGAHGVVGERGAFPGLDARGGGGAAGGEEGGGGEQQGEEAAGGAHGAERKLRVE